MFNQGPSVQFIWQVIWVFTSWWLNSVSFTLLVSHGVCTWKAKVPSDYVESGDLMLWRIWDLERLKELLSSGHPVTRVESYVVPSVLHESDLIWMKWLVPWVLHCHMAVLTQTHNQIPVTVGRTQNKWMALLSSLCFRVTEKQIVVHIFPYMPFLF